MARRTPRASPTRLTPAVVEAYQQARFRCSDPSCGQWVVLDHRYTTYVDPSGREDADNLLPLCPACYDIAIPPEALAAWKSVQLATPSPYDFDSFTFLAFLEALDHPLPVSADRLLDVQQVVAAGAVSATPTPAGEWALELSVAGQLQLEAWRQGRVPSEESVVRGRFAR